MTPDLAAARAARGLPPYRHEAPTWRNWTTEEVAMAVDSTPEAIAQRAKRGQFRGATQVPGAGRAGRRWSIPDEAARAFIAQVRAHPAGKRFYHATEAA